MTKSILRVLKGERVDPPPVWLMRQAGRYLPEYRETRAEAGSFLQLCDNPALAAEVTLQPIRRFGFDAAIIFADILLICRALGADLWFVEGEGPRLSTITTKADFAKLKKPGDIHDALAPVYETLRLVKEQLPDETTLIGFAGSPWTVATYMIAGRGTPDQAPAHKLKDENRALFEKLINLITDATIEYLSRQIDAGAEVVKLFDSWAGSLEGQDFDDFCIAPTATIVAALKDRHPKLPIIVFPREAKTRYEGFARETGADCVAIDNSVAPEWASETVQSDGPVQGNLDPKLMVTGGDELVQATKKVLQAFSMGPHIFNLGHGITPDADPENVKLLLKTIRG
ncbi:MAG: uroporphyrinogen decarboxylase [Deltaproteobacteria bacterium]